MVEMKTKKYKTIHALWFLFCSLMFLMGEHLFLFRNSFHDKSRFFIFILFTGFMAFCNVHPDLVSNIKDKKLHHCAGGVFLLKLFLFTTAVSIILVIFYQNYDIKTLVWIFMIELITFWNGIIRTYIYSTQMGIKLRVLGALCGMIPVVHLILLFIIIKTVDYEIELETEKEEINEKRKDLKVCATKYPLVFVHGVFFRDFRHFNYWGRIPDELIKNGAEIYYGNHESATPVKKSAEELAARIKDILKETGAEKVNIIAHSKGGLDCRYMISRCFMEDYVASLTTINTPHRGCEFAEYLLNEKFPEETKETIASTYNKALKLLGDKEPDFLAAVTDLTQKACVNMNTFVTDSSKVYYQSVGSILENHKGGRFPLNYSYHIVKEFDGENDGLVGEKSFEWGSNFTLLRPKGKRGISHGDMIDLNRENIPGFDVREFYVKLVSGLKEQGF